jgi:putative flippase GtrA
MIKQIIDKLKSLLTIPFIRFAIVGFGGMVTNLLIFYILVDVLALWVNVIPFIDFLNLKTGTNLDPLKFWANAVAVFTFLLVGTQNYVLHHLWTFRETTAGKKLSVSAWLKFNLTASIGLGISLIVMNLVLYFFVIPFKVIAQGCGVFAGTAMNYLGSKYLVFNKKKIKNKDKKPESASM